MEAIVLCRRNCHRADKIRQISNPENGDWTFEFRGQKLREGFMHTEYAHLASKPGFGNAVVISDSDKEMKLWEVVSWKYDISFDDLWDRAVRAYEGTSFIPEVRAATAIREYESLVIEDLKNLPTEEHDDYVNRFKELVGVLFDKHSRVLSSMITGPANFPVKRNEKANSSFDRAVNEFNEWRAKYAKRSAKRIEAAKSPEERESEEWLGLKREIDFHVQTCVEIDTGKNTYSYRTAFTNSISGKIGRLANNGKASLVMKALAYIKEVQESDKTGLKKPLFTSRHKIWKFQEVCEQSIQRRTEREGHESVEIPFDGGKVVKNFAEDRLQIFHDKKPDSNVILSLKRNGFKWSRFNGCWQRQLTSNAFYGAARVIIGEGFEHNDARGAFVKSIYTAK
jgi:hypothetical protein|nr:MAG TPA: hypothetical protein [Caudoviricetes sp.]